MFGAAAEGNSLRQQLTAIPSDRRPVTVDDPCAPVPAPKLRLGGFTRLRGSREEDGPAVRFNERAVEHEAPCLCHQMLNADGGKHRMDADAANALGLLQLYPVVPAAAGHPQIAITPGITHAAKIAHFPVPFPVEPLVGAGNDTGRSRRRQLLYHGEAKSMGIFHGGHSKGRQPAVIQIHPIIRQIEGQLQAAKPIVLFHGLIHR